MQRHPYGHRPNGRYRGAEGRKVKKERDRSATAVVEGKRNPLFLDGHEIANAFVRFCNGEFFLCVEEFNPKTLLFAPSSKQVNHMSHYNLCLKDLFVSGDAHTTKQYKHCTLNGFLDLLKMPMFNAERHWDINRKLTITNLARNESKGAYKFLDSIADPFQEIIINSVRGYALNLEGALVNMKNARRTKSISVTGSDITYDTPHLLFDIFKQVQCKSVTLATNNATSLVPFFKKVFNGIRGGEVNGDTKMFHLGFRAIEREPMEAYVEQGSVRTEESHIYVCNETIRVVFYSEHLEITF